ncbi:MAG: hydroxymethylglutaryl-CoA lyase [Flavobacteriales bacterium]|nr:hydroxymethylglutaryl-CoA lyase [Flavobacteriales bacterium]
MNNKIKVTECPRDAMQGISQFICTQDKANYINSLFKVGFDIIDFGSFVSPKAVPQMRDTYDLVSLLEITNKTQLLSVVLNKRGALQASSFDSINIIGYPLSISEIFQKNNSNNDIKTSLSIIDEIQNICIKKNKTLLVYFSMAFGNPYGERWNQEILLNYIKKIEEKGVKMISLADTIGNSSITSIQSIYSESSYNFPDLDIGLHLHSERDDVYNKIQSAWNAGCKRFDVAMNGYGGCPFAQNKLIGNIPSEKLLNFLANNNIKHSLDLLAFESAFNQAKFLFNKYSS